LNVALGGANAGQTCVTEGRTNAYPPARLDPVWQSEHLWTEATATGDKSKRSRTTAAGMIIDQYLVRIGVQTCLEPGMD